MKWKDITDVVSGSMTVEKAQLHLYKPYGTVMNEKPNAGANAGTPSLPGNAAASFDSKLKSFDSAANTLKKEKERLQQVEKKSREIKNRIEGAAGTQQPEQQKQPKQPEERNTRKEEEFKVIFQFNPAALHIRAYGGGMASITCCELEEGSTGGTNEKKGCSTMDYGPVNETVTVSFKVVFDAVNNEKAFPTDRVNPSPTNLARQGVSLMKRKSYTVRPIVEGFLSSVRDSSTRRADFYWGSMHYGGYLNQVECRYTMFDIQGEAVRAEVDLSLVCSCHKDNDNQKEWRDRYHEFMKDRSADFGLSDKKWQSFFRAAVGRTEKACILFRTVHKDTAAQKIPDFEAPGISGLSQMAEAISKEALKVTPKKKAGGESEPAVAETVTDNASLSEKVKKAGYVPVTVHYNPASITMRSRGGETVTREGGSADPSGTARFQYNAISPETVLSMELFFDDTDNANAFMLDAGMSSPTGLGRAVKNMGSRVKNGQCSVKSISELFVAATASADTRLVCFVWNKMVFWGELCEVEAEYTMFSNRGNPIRSKVRIHIRQDMDPGKNGTYDGIWKKAFYQLGEEAEKLVSDKSMTGSSWNHIASNLFHM